MAFGVIVLVFACVIITVIRRRRQLGMGRDYNQDQRGFGRIVNFLSRPSGYSQPGQTIGAGVPPSTVPPGELNLNFIGLQCTFFL